MKSDDSTTAPPRPPVERTLLLLAVLLLLVPPVWALFEVQVNRRGPGAAPPSEAAGLAGRALLGQALQAHEADAWRGRPAVAFDVECQKVFGGGVLLKMAVDPGTRSATITEARTGQRYRYGGADKSLTPAGADSGYAAALRTLAPSLVFWSLVPFNLDDPAAQAWQLAPVTRGGERRNRLAVRWPNSVEWYIFELRATDSRVAAVEFRSAGTPALIRWRGEAEGLVRSDGVQLPATWHFRPAHPGLALLFGMQDVYTFRYQAAAPAGAPPTSGGPPAEPPPAAAAPADTGRS